LQNRDSADWGSVLARFDRLIVATVFKICRRFGTVDKADIDDLVQEIYVRLCADDYRILRQSRITHAGAIYGLIQAVSTTTVLDHFRARRAQKRGASKVVPLSADQQAVTWEAHTYDRSLLIGEIDEHLFRLGDSAAQRRDRRIFWLYYRSGLTSRDIASIPGLELTQKGVESVIRRLTLELKHLLKYAPAESKGESA
jgi:RNA polymerase sigma-70 factor (ECF subfamily)